MTDYDLPELPSDEELGISDMEDEPKEAPRGRKGKAEAQGKGRGSDAGPPPPSGRGPGGSGGGADGRGTAGRPPAPARPWLGPLTLLLLLGLAYLTAMGRALPDPVPLDAADGTFSSGRAMLDIVDIARSAHPPGSPEHARVREMLMDRLQELGLEPQVQTATTVRRRGGTVSAATVRNVLARLPGTASTGAIVLTAHYDGRGISRGAGDDGTGVATILETVRAVQAGEPLQNDLIVLLTDAEELGLMGARAFVQEHPWMEDVAVVLSVEMRGGGGPSTMFETGTENGWIIQALGAGDPRPFANSLSEEVYRRMPNDTDFTPFRQAGVQGLNFAAIGRAHVYHQQYDAPGRLDERTVQHHGLHLLGMVQELGTRELTDVDAADRAYFTLPLVGLVSYPPAVVWGLSVALLLAAVLVFLLVHRSGGTVVGVVVGFVLALATMAVSAGAGWLLFSQIQSLHPEEGALHGSAFHVEGWYVAALAAVALAVAVGLLALVRRRLSLGALGLGAVALPLLMSLVLTGAAPMGAHVLQWPALAGLVGVALVAGVGPGMRVGLLRWLGLVLVAAVVLAFLVSLVQLVWLAMSLRAALLVGAAVALPLVFLVPLLDALREPGGGWAPILAVVSALVLLGVGMLHSRPSRDRPLPSTLVYALDRDSARAVWATRPGPGSAWARQRVGVFEDTAALPQFLLGEIPYQVRGGENAEPDRPHVELQDPGDASGPGAGRRVVGLAVESAVGAEMLALRLPASEDVFLQRVNGIEVPPEEPGSRSGPGRASVLQHWGTPEGALRIELDVGPNVQVVPLQVIEHHLRPEELVGQAPFLRPPGLAPDITTLSDRAVLRGTLLVDLEAGEVRWIEPGEATGPAGAAGEGDDADEADGPGDEDEAGDGGGEGTAGDTVPAGADTLAEPDTTPTRLSPGPTGGTAHPEKSP